MQKALIASAQIRAARALLRWSSHDLAAASGIGIATIKRMEVMDGVPAGNVRTLVALQSALEAEGIEFIENTSGSIGVMLHEKKLL